MLRNDSTRFRKACISTTLSLRENTGPIASGDYSTPVSQRGTDGQNPAIRYCRPSRCAAQINRDIEAHGAYYGVVCNAGITADNAFPSLTGKEWDSVVHTNLDGFYNVLRSVVMPMVRRRKPGRIVTLSSVSGLMGNRGQVNYSAAKAGIIGVTKALALELAKRDITVNCVAPGLIDTEMVNELPLDEIKKMIPARRVGSTREVAAAAFLISGDAGYITRQVISVNGGLC